MAPLIALHVTEINVAIKLSRLVLFYCIDPHCAGWWIYRPERPENPKVRMTWFGQRRKTTGIR
jgi:hypothetical protein